MKNSIMPRKQISRRTMLGTLGVATAGLALTPNIAQAISISIGGGGSSGGLLSTKNLTTLFNMAKEMNFTEEDEIRLGEELFPSLISGSGGIYRNDKIQSALIQIAQKVLASSPRKELPWQVVAVADNSVNAWALPGGKIAINSGLLRYAANEDELAAVLAHEIGHVNNKHAVEQIKSKSFIGGLSSIGQSALNSELQKHGTAGYAASSVIGELEGPMMEMVTSGFGRDAEFEADANIATAFRVSGHSVERGVGIFETLLELLPANTTQTTSLYSTHPETRERIDTILRNQAAADAQAADDKEVSPAFAAIKETFPTREVYMRNRTS